MSTLSQFARAASKVSAAAHRLQWALPLALAAFGLSAAASPSQATSQAPAQSPVGAVGRIEGKDISVESTVSIGSGVGQSAPGALVSNGSIVTVHSGHARLTLFAGGQVQICGPAKFTMLQTNGAITLALNFGRIRVQLPHDSSLRVFTPNIVATPLDISGGSRDVAVGLNLDDSLCVRATSGAIQLEHQFSGEKLIVPQTGEFFLNAGALLPVAGVTGSCGCDEAENTPIIVPAPAAPPQYAVVVSRPAASAQPAPRPLPAPEFATPQPPSMIAAVPPAELAKPEPDFDLQLLARASEAHPLAPPSPSKDVVQAPPDPPAPTYVSTTTAASALTYIAPELRPPYDPGPDVILLIRQAQIAREWEFTGHVNAPEFALAVQHALGQSTAQPPASTHQKESKPATQEKKKGGFWAALKRAFGGSSGPQQD
jgi:hypothetical protein